jgi:hypothetical protein
VERSAGEGEQVLRVGAPHGPLVLTEAEKLGDHGSHRRRHSAEEGHAVVRFDPGPFVRHDHQILLRDTLELRARTREGRLIGEVLENADAHREIEAHVVKGEERAYLLKQAMREVLADGMSEDDRKRIVKEAINEWLDERLAVFGKWSLTGICAAALALLAYLLLVKAGWKPPL